MKLDIAISDRTAAWLKGQACAAGLTEASLAARLLEDMAQQKLGDNGSARADRLSRFREWANGVPARPGPPVDVSRERMYE